MGSFEKSLGKLLRQKDEKESQGKKPDAAQRSELTSIGLRTGEKKTESLETKVYSTEFIKERIASLLESVSVVEKINSLNVKGKNSQIVIDTAITAKKILTIDIKVAATLESEKGVIQVKSHKIEASKFEKNVEDMLVPKLAEVSGLLRSYIENEERRNVEKMEIIKGELHVTFKPEEQESKEQSKENKESESGTQEQEKSQDKKAERIAELRQIIEDKKNTIKENEIREKKILERLAKIKAEKIEPQPDRDEERQEIRNAGLGLGLAGLENSLAYCRFWEFKKREEIRNRIAKLKAEIERERKERSERKK